MEASAGGRPGAPDIYLVGLGIVGVWHLTKEAEACLRTSRHAFLVDAGFGVAEYVSELGPQVHNLLFEYRDRGNRVDTYRRMAAWVVDAALVEGPVSFAVYGHPSLFVYPSQLIRRAGELLGLTVHTAPGISSLDTILIDLDLDPGLNGLQIYDANALLVENRSLDPEVPCLILQPDAVESAFHTRAPSRPSRFRRLEAHLLRFYPPDHTVTSVRSSTHPLFEGERTTFELSRLSELFAENGLTGTLYLPPARKSAEYDEELVRQVFDPLHLNRITYPTDYP
jgi:uncharacterized protein YabN with tetrapyrrole methylase and pyrophosphatase domain